MENFTKVVGAIVLGLGAILALSCVCAFPVKWCWNTAIAPIFHMQEIGALQGWCLAFLGSSFFKSSTSLKCKHD